MHVDRARTRIDAAPRLPVPRPTRWNSLVHLHGSLDDCGRNREGLVLSSADFGAAYLVDGWATRFLRELFYNFVVLFVGYQAKDMVIRYMLQALAVSFAESGKKPQVFAFTEIEDTEELTRLAWESRGIRPILYPKGSAHLVLHQTLRAWADNSSLGLLGRRSLVAERLCHPPPADHDEVVDQVIWALRDGTGATANYVAECEPSPSPEHWMGILDENQLFALDRVPLVTHVDSAIGPQPINPVTWHLGIWLTRHLSNPAILDWVLGKGASLHPTYRWLLRSELEKHRSTLRPEMWKAWAFLTHLRPDTGTGDSRDPWELISAVESGRWDLDMKGDVAAMLEPSVVLSRDRIIEALRSQCQCESENYPLDVDIRVKGGVHARDVLDKIWGRPDRDTILAGLLQDCAYFLQRAMEALEYFEHASQRDDGSSIVLRSISGSLGEHHLVLLCYKVTT